MHTKMKTIYQNILRRGLEVNGQVNDGSLLITFIGGSILIRKFELRHGKAPRKVIVGENGFAVYAMSAGDYE